MGRLDAALRRLLIPVALLAGAACDCDGGELPPGGDPDGGTPDAAEADAEEGDAADADPSADAEPLDSGADGGFADASIDAGFPPCEQCHGQPGQPAPPPDTTGHFDPSAPGVGAHRVHLRSSQLFRAGRCDDCHVLPDPSAPWAHADGRPAEVEITPLGAAGNTYSSSTAECSTYCHGRTLPSPGVLRPTWNKLDGTQVYCGSCHAIPPPRPHPPLPTLSCTGCHPFNVLSPIDPETHVNGILDLAGDGDCGVCHPVPPKTGAHQRHYGEVAMPPRATYGDLSILATSGLGDAPYYLFGCGHCHPIDPSRHLDGNLDVELVPQGAPSDSLKARSSVTAAYAPATGTCSGVYCHSSGQLKPTYVDSPPWRSLLPESRCASCHGNPPRNPSTGAGTDGANSHLVVADDGWPFGHFAGLPGPWHTSYHGTRGSAPITCQTCHFATVDPTNVGPGGFYYLDTEGDFDVGAPDPIICADCHTGAAGAPARGPGEIRPFTHVNGARDVVFDVRTTLSSTIGGLPLGADRPRYPYWVRARPAPADVPPNSEITGAIWSLHLGGATYEPATKTCTSVPCHLKQSFGTGAPELDPLRWGQSPVGRTTCPACHQMGF